MPEIGTTRNIVPMSGYRLEIDGLGDVRAKSVGAIEQELSKIEIREGGRIRVVQQEVNLLTTSDIEVERPMDLNDRRASDIWERTKDTQDVHLNGTFFYIKAGNDVAKRELRDIIMTKFSDGEGDAENEDEPMMEKFTLSVLDVGPIEVIE